MKEPQKRLRLFGYENRFKRFLVFKKSAIALLFLTKKNIEVQEFRSSEEF
jgi:hypothetical protein